jgi:hypothetical protein
LKKGNDERKRRKKEGKKEIKEEREEVKVCLGTLIFKQG